MSASETPPPPALGPYLWNWGVVFGAGLALVAPTFFLVPRYGSVVLEEFMKGDPVLEGYAVYDALVLIVASLIWKRTRS